MFQFLGVIILLIVNLIGMVLSFLLTILMLPFYILAFVLAAIGIHIDNLPNEENKNIYASIMSTRIIPTLLGIAH